MLTPPKTVAVALAIATTLVLAGCVQSAPQVIPTSEPTVKPVFATDADALAAAEKVYVAYLAVSDQILIDGGKNPDRLLTVATPAELESQKAGFAEFESKGWRSTGGTAVDSMTLQGYFPNLRKGIVSVYVCVNVTKTDVLDASGKSVVSSSRPSRQPFQATFDLAPDNANKLALADQKPWSGKGVCE